MMQKILAIEHKSFCDDYTNKLKITKSKLNRKIKSDLESESARRLHYRERYKHCLDRHSGYRNPNRWPE